MKSRAEYRFPFSRYPAVRIVLLLMAGLLFVHFFSPPIFWTAGCFMITLALFSFLEWKAKRTISIILPKIATVLFLLLIFSFGAFRMSMNINQKQSILINLIHVSPWDEITVAGKIHAISLTTNEKERWDVEVHQSKIGDITSSKKYLARILADDDPTEATIGDSVFFSGTIIPVSEKRNPLDFDYKKYLYSQGIEVQIRVDSLIQIIPNSKSSEWVWWREKALSLVEKNFTKRTAPIAKALLLGYKQDLDSESKTAFARAGLSHIMAVSGLHVGFIVAPFWVIIPFFWTKKYGSQIGLIFLILILLTYAGITGFSASVMRASVMAVFLTYGKLFYKINDSINLTAAAAIVLLIINPSQLFEIGFQLSFSAVLIILLILPVIQNLLPYWVRIRWYGTPIMVVIVSLVVQFGLYPLQVFYFGEISLISPLANALFVPFLGLVVPLSLAAIFITAITSSVGFIINYPSLLFLDLMAEFVNQATEWSWAWSSASLSTALIFLLWIFLIFGISAHQTPSLRWKMLIGFLALCCLISTQNIIQKVTPKKLEITFFDVGQGDAALLKTPSGKHVLIDVGVWSPGYNSGKSVILPHLQNSGIEKIDAVILSHPHADHIGGIIDVLQEVPIDVIYNSGYSYDSNLYQSYLTLAKDKNIPLLEVSAGDTLGLDPVMLFLIMGPDGNYYSKDPNEHSVVMNVIYGETEFLFTGDAGEIQEKRILDSYGTLLDTDLLKVGHHGSRTSSGTSFLDKVTPEIAVVSLAKRNRFRHPHREALQRLHQTKAELLFTSRERAIVFESDGEKIERIYW
ncbi:MAG: DNA internalization-related competence protein ComEC/Rec2 [Balneolaceae bacterium]